MITGRLLTKHLKRLLFSPPQLAPTIQTSLHHATFPIWPQLALYLIDECIVPSSFPDVDVYTCDAILKRCPSEALFLVRVLEKHVHGGGCRRETVQKYILDAGLEATNEQLLRLLSGLSEHEIKGSLRAVASAVFHEIIHNMNKPSSSLCKQTGKLLSRLPLDLVFEKVYTLNLPEDTFTTVMELVLSVDERRIVSKRCLIVEMLNVFIGKAVRMARLTEPRLFRDCDE
jgi:hypothetical protein